LENWQPNSRLAGPRARRAEVEHFRNSFPREALFLDLETCGFAGSMVFLIGLVWCDGERLVIDQLLARNYAEEKAALHSLHEIAGRRSVLVTFNGKSFDWPMVQDRSIRHKLLMPASTGKQSALAPRPHPGPLPEGEGERHGQHSSSGRRWAHQ